MDNPVIARYFDIVGTVSDRLGPGWPNTQDLVQGVQGEIDNLPEGLERQTLQEIHAKFAHALAG